jgi:Ca-activated chloride channel family protein
MKRLYVIITLFVIIAPLIVYAGGHKEAASSAERGEYLAGRGIVVPPEEVHTDSYVSYIDYNYPRPKTELGVTLYTGHQQISSRGQEEIIQIGIQGRETSFEELPPMNLAFVIDKSWSMGEQEKMEWVKESFDIFIGRVRDKDFVSLVVFDDEARVIFPSTRMSTMQKREMFKRSVHSIIPGGVDNLEAGLMLGYQQVQANYRKEYINRVLLLSDGTEMSSRLKREAAKSGDVRVSLIWNNRNDLDLHVISPSGEEIFYARKKSWDGGELDVDMNVRGETTKPVENIFWPRGGAPVGRYKVFVRNYHYHERNRGDTFFEVELWVNNEVTRYKGNVYGTGKYSDRIVCDFNYTGSDFVKTERTGIMQMAEYFRDLGINVSTIGVGVDFNLELMRNLADKGGGSSRFISSREQMEKTFGSELDRMIVPEARDVEMKLVFLQDVEILNTWGYENRIEGNTIYYSLPTLHHRDYETILVQIWIPPQKLEGRKNLARFFLTYDDTLGKKHHTGPHYVRATFVDMESPVAGFSNTMVLQSGTHLHFAQALKEIGRLYYSHQVERALEITVAAKKELNNSNLRLGSDDFNDQISILDKYIDILGEDLQMAVTETRRIALDHEIAPQVSGRSLHEHCKNLFQEMTLAMEKGGQGAIAVSGFTTRDGKTSDLITLLNEMAMLEIAKHRNLQVVERDKLDMVLDEQKLALSDLVDTTNAIKVGKLLTVTHILTGTVLEMPGSVVIFGRIINVESGEIESAAQVIVSRNREVEALL